MQCWATDTAAMLIRINRRSKPEATAPSPGAPHYDMSDVERIHADRQTTQWRELSSRFMRLLKQHRARTDQARKDLNIPLKCTRLFEQDRKKVTLLYFYFIFFVVILEHLCCSLLGHKDK